MLYAFAKNKRRIDLMVVSGEAGSFLALPV
jgi:hypothetical protein